MSGSVKSVVIEQLYEEGAHSSTYTPSETSNTVSCKAIGHKKEMKIPLKKSSIPKSANSSKSRSISVITTAENASKVAETSIPKTQRRKPSSPSSVPTGHTAEKMTSKTAIAVYGNKLSPHERKEILNYPQIYYLGLKANKVKASDSDSIHNSFDDEENFYKVVPKDHIAYRFEISERPNLGKGTFAQVIKAYDHKDGRHVALKLVRNEKIYLKQSREELRILQVLRKQDPHSIYNVITLHEFFMFRNHMVICFELLGINLYQVLKRTNFRGLSSQHIMPIARAVCKCLELLYRNRIIHCDIKPENIMLRRNGDITHVKVGDFGSSCYEQQQMYHYIQSRYYRAPEVLLGLRYGPAIDMWSYGCVLAELFTGSPLFVGSDEDDQLSAIEEIVGEIPQSLMSKAKNRQGVSRGRSRGAPGSKPFNVIMEGEDLFMAFMKKVLELEPTRRPTPLELQQHPWMCPSSRCTLSSQRRARGRSSSDTAMKKGPKK